MSSSVLVVDRDPRDAEIVSAVLMNRGYKVRTARDADAVMSNVRAACPALIIADFGPLLVDGIELCQRVRCASNVPIIAVSSNADSWSEVAALDAGADDYLLKPWSPDKLLARVRVALRRSGEAAESSALDVGEFNVDFNDRRVHVHGRPVRLTPKEFDLFVFLARHPNRVLPHKTLLGAVWGEAFLEQSEYLRVFMGQLRKKLESNPSNPRYLVTEPWVGYRFNPTGLVQ